MKWWVFNPKALTSLQRHPHLRKEQQLALASLILLIHTRVRNILSKCTGKDEDRSTVRQRLRNSPEKENELTHDTPQPAVSGETASGESRAAETHQQLLFIITYSNWVLRSRDNRIDRQCSNQNRNMLGSSASQTECPLAEKLASHINSSSNTFQD